MIQVYHYSFDAREPNDMLMPIMWSISQGDLETIKEVWDNNVPEIAYLPVAFVDTESLDMAFTLTNHIDESWTKNVRVDPLLTKVRSTSIGDILVKDNKKYVVGMVGFDELVEHEV